MPNYFCRFTPVQNEMYNLGMLQFIIEKLELSKYVMSCEQEPREHYHIALWGVNYTAEALRVFLKRKLDGQVYISGKDIEDKIKTIAYTIKDGLYVHKGLDINDFLLANTVTKKKIKYDAELQVIDKAYDGNDKEYLTKVFDLHVKTNKKVYMQHIKSQLLLVKLKHDKYGTYKSYLIEKIIDNM